MSYAPSRDASNNNYRDRQISIEINSRQRINRSGRESEIEKAQMKFTARVRYERNLRNQLLNLGRAQNENQLARPSNASQEERPNIKLNFNE